MDNAIDRTVQPESVLLAQDANDKIRNEACKEILAKVDELKEEFGEPELVEDGLQWAAEEIQ